MKAEERKSVINKAELAEEEKQLIDLSQENETLKARLAEQKKRNKLMQKIILSSFRLKNNCSI